MKRRASSRGFTLIEILVVVAIIGILATLAITNYLTAMQKARQKRTMNDIRTIATAWELRAVDTHFYNASGFTVPAQQLTGDQLNIMLAPTYLRHVPPFDGWGQPFVFSADAAIGSTSPAGQYAIRSPARDGQLSGDTYAAGPTTNFDCDIVFAGGKFIAWPEGTQEK